MTHATNDAGQTSQIFATLADEAWQQLGLSNCGPVLGVGTGTTVEALCAAAHQESFFPRDKTVVVSSIRTQRFLTALG